MVRMNEFKMLAKVTVCLVASLLLVIYSMGAIVNKLTVGGDIAKIEQLRSDAQKVHTGNNEDVVGQVTQWNQEIRNNQWYNSRWWAALLIPNEWDAVKPIEIPKQ